MSIDSIRDLRLFTKIFEHGSISAASESLGITPAVASKHLQRLEAGTGEPLFHRSTRTLSPTGAGVLLYDHALTILATVEDAELALNGGDEPSGFLRVTSSIAFGRRYIAPIISAFLKRYRGVQIDAVFTDATLDMVNDGIDLAVRICLPVAHPGLIMRRLCSGRRQLCASPIYLQTYGVPESPKDLKQHNCVVLNEYSVWKLRRDKQSESIRVKGSLQSNDGETVLDALRSDVGIGVVALWHGGEDLKVGRLVRVLEKYELCPQPDVYAVYHPNQKHLARIQTLLRFIEERLRITTRASESS
jgi:DNA-binding transcriptional LysR family regulator